ncbi:hypothetical protein COOONC_10619 [Cooperia oncophora]
MNKEKSVEGPSIEFKIHKITTPQKSKKTAVPDSIPSTETSEAAVSVEASSSSNKADSLTLEEVMDSEKHLVVGGTPYSIIREPVDIASISCSVKPLAGCPIYPAIDFRQGQSKVDFVLLMILSTCIECCRTSVD